MGNLRDSDVQRKEREFLALTSLTVDEFERLLFSSGVKCWRIVKDICRLRHP
ncbi:MAG: hypothetical protein U0350_26245 [Caldilineaceae bacterium]